MNHGALLAIAVFPVCAQCAPATTLAHLPNTGINAVQVDASGSIYIAGYHGTAGATAGWDAFVAKLSPDGSKILFSTTFAGSKYDNAVALQIDSAGAAYIFGETQSPDFPVTPGALQTTMPPNSDQGFAAKVDAQGKVIYATLIGGASTVQPYPGGLAVDAAGEAILSGSTVGDNFPATTGAPFTSTDRGASFVLKLDSTGAKLLAAIRGVGGRVALDGQGNIYVAGPAAGSIPLSPGAFQSNHQFNACSGTSGFSIGCLYQYVTKLNAGLSQIAYSTYITGSSGAVPVGISVDAQGDVVVAGTTNSPDYPTSSGAFEPLYAATTIASQFPPGVPGNLNRLIVPPPASGYITKLNATGTGLVWSTFFSGTENDTIGFAAFTNSAIWLSGKAGSADLPGLEGVPSPCLPQTYATHFSADGSSVGATRIISGNVLAYAPLTGALVSWTGTDLVSFDPEAPPDLVACIVDAVDQGSASTVAPGELLSIFGPHFVSGEEIAVPSGGLFPASLQGITVTFNGIAGPLLFVSPQQINVQVPFEIAGNSQVTVAVTSRFTSISDSRPLLVSPRNPVAFLDRDPFIDSGCSANGDVNIFGGGPVPLAFNSDGSRNTCGNRAKAGTVVTIFFGGLGVTEPAPVTGSVNANPGVALNLPITSGGDMFPAVEAPGSIAGVWQVSINGPPPCGASICQGPFYYGFSADSVPVRDSVVIWWAGK